MQQADRESMVTIVRREAIAPMPNDRGCKRLIAGYSLMELLTVMLIIGVLVAIAVPNYSKTMERAYCRQAQDLLLTVYHGERSYFLTNGQYLGGLVACNGSNKSGCIDAWRAIQMDDPNATANAQVSFGVTSSKAPATFVGTATRQNGANPTLQIDDTRTVSGSWQATGNCP